MAYSDDIPRTPSSVGSLEGSVPIDMYGSVTTARSALNNPQNTSTVGPSGNQGVGVQYPNGRTNVTRSGHVLQFNDTPAGERVLLKHRTGSAVDMLPDGSMAISSNGGLVITVMKDQTIVIHGNVKYEVNGDFDFNVKGNFNVKALNYNLEVEGNQTETVRGSSRSTVSGNKGTVVKGSTSLTTLGTITQTSLGNTNTIAKGTLMTTAGGNIQIASGGSMKTSAASGYDVASTNINIAGNSTTVVGATGTFGGEGVHVYAKNARVQKTVYAETMQANTFYGDLEGTARDAQEAGTAGGTGPVTIGSLTVTATDGTSTALPNGALMTDYLTLSPKGIIQVDIDTTGDLYNMIDRTQFTKGLSRDALDTSGVRSKLRDEGNLANSEFTAGAIAEGTLSPTYANPAPGGISRASTSDPSAWIGNPDIGNSEPAWIKAGPKPAKKPFLTDAKSKILPDTTVSEKTLLINGIPLSTFLRG